MIVRSDNSIQDIAMITATNSKIHVIWVIPKQIIGRVATLSTATEPDTKIQAQELHTAPKTTKKQRIHEMSSNRPAQIMFPLLFGQPRAGNL